MTPEQLRQKAKWAQKAADICGDGTLQEHADQLLAHAAALEEIERLKGTIGRYMMANNTLAERAENAERRAERLKVHAEAMAARIEWYAEEGWVNGDIPEARAYRADKEK